MEKLHPKAVWIFFFRFLFQGLIPFFFISIWLTGFLAQLGGLGYLWWVILVFIFFVVFCWIWAKLTYSFWLYDLTEDTFKKECGVIWKKYVSIPYEKIQNVDIYRGILARILGLSDLMIQTAGYTGGGGSGRGFRMPEGYLPGLGREKAENLRDELIKRAKGNKQGL